MLDWRAMTVTVHLAPRYMGHSLSVQYYEFYLHAILFQLLIQTRPLRLGIVVKAAEETCYLVNNFIMTVFVEQPLAKPEVLLIIK